MGWFPAVDLSAYRLECKRKLEKGKRKAEATRLKGRGLLTE